MSGHHHFSRLTEGFSEERKAKIARKVAILKAIEKITSKKSLHSPQKRLLFLKSSRGSDFPLSPKTPMVTRGKRLQLPPEIFRI